MFIVWDLTFQKREEKTPFVSAFDLEFDCSSKVVVLSLVPSSLRALKVSVLCRPLAVVAQLAGEDSEAPLAVAIACVNRQGIVSSKASAHAEKGHEAKPLFQAPINESAFFFWLP
jgi:hypothetical protein